MSTRLIVADPFPLYRASVAGLVAEVFGQTAIEVGDEEALFDELAAGTAVGFVALNLDLPGAKGNSPLVRLRSRLPQVPVLAMGIDDDPGLIARARQFGASGFASMACSSGAMSAAIEAVIAGRGWSMPDTRHTAPTALPSWRQVDQLTPQQLRVLGLLADGLSNRNVGQALGVSENTVRCHVTAILSKLECRSRTQAALLLNSFRA